MQLSANIPCRAHALQNIIGALGLRDTFVPCHVRNGCLQAGDEVPPGAHSGDAPAGLGSPPSGAASVAPDMPNEAPGQAPPGAPGEEATAPGMHGPCTPDCVRLLACISANAAQENRACCLAESHVGCGCSLLHALHDIIALTFGRAGLLKAKWRLSYFALLVCDVVLGVYVIVHSSAVAQVSRKTYPQMRCLSSQARLLSRRPRDPLGQLRSRCLCRACRSLLWQFARAHSLIHILSLAAGRLGPRRHAEAQNWAGVGPKYCCTRRLHVSVRCMTCSAVGWGLPVMCLHCLRYVALYWVFRD